MVRNIFAAAVTVTAALMLIVSPVFAGGAHDPAPKDPGYSTSSAATAVGVGIGIGGGASVENKFTPTNVNQNVFTPTNNNTNVGINSQGQDQKQKQQQGQAQGQKQGQNNEQTIAPYQGQDVKVDASTNFDRYAPSVAAPALTAAGTGVCLGSVSFGLSGPMAGASFGITKVDKGCEQRSAAALLYQMGYKDAAVRLLMKNEDVKDALGADAPPAASKASTRPAAVTPAASDVQPMIDNRGAAVAPTALQSQLAQIQGM